MIAAPTAAKRNKFERFKHQYAPQRAHILRYDQYYIPLGRK